MESHTARTHRMKCWFGGKLATLGASATVYTLRFHHDAGAHSAWRRSAYGQPSCAAVKARLPSPAPPHAHGCFTSTPVFPTPLTLTVRMVRLGAPASHPYHCHVPLGTRAAISMPHVQASTCPRDKENGANPIFSAALVAGATVSA